MKQGIDGMIGLAAIDAKGSVVYGDNSLLIRQCDCE